MLPPNVVSDERPGLPIAQGNLVWGPGTLCYLSTIVFHLCIERVKMVQPRLSTGAQIPRFYAGRDIFITGATGFMGKVLVERLLSTCPDIGRLHLLMRTKKEVHPEKRLQALKQSPVFDVLRANNPSQLDKLLIIPGDVTQPQLGIDMDALTGLQNVSVVFHSAATLKFDEELRLAVEQNVRSVIRIMELCDLLPNVEAFVHVSTAYSNAELDTVEERVYPPPAPLAELLALVDAAPTNLLADITNKYIYPKPNTYTYTKAMAETAVEQHCNRGYSVAIFRPTIVVSSLKHPFPGWIENLNGPSGVIVGAGKGLLHVFGCKLNARADMLPVDIAIDTLIAVAWETAIDRSPEVKVYNCSTYENPTTWREFEHTMRHYLCGECPLDGVLWYPSGHATENLFMEKLLQFMLQTVPLHLAEYVCRVFGVKHQISLITADQRIRSMTSVLKFFTMKEWRFETGNTRRLRARLTEQDDQIYNLDPDSIKWVDHYSDFVKGIRRYLLKEKDQDLKTAQKHMQRMRLLHNSVVLIISLGVLRLLLRNQMTRDIVYGTLRLLSSLLQSGFKRIRS